MHAPLPRCKPRQISQNDTGLTGDCKLARCQARAAMNRADAFALLSEYTKNPSLIKHMFAVEAAMRAYARKLGQDEEHWGIVGLLHDFDYERWPDAPNHPLQGAAILK